MQLIAEKGKTDLIYPEVVSPPQGWLGVSPFVVRGKTTRFWPRIPRKAQERILEAVPTFGMDITVYVPIKSPTDFCPLASQRRGDPIVLGQKANKHYLIVAWE